MSQEQLYASVNDFVLAIGLLVRRLRTEGGAQQVSGTQAAVMSRLATDGASTISDLARAESLKPQTMGTTIAALEEMGVVERRPHPTDKRQFYIALTDEGADLRDRIRAAKRAWLAEAIAGLDEQEQQALFTAGVIIKRLVES